MAMTAGEERYTRAAGRWAPTALYDPVVALTMRERTFRRAVVQHALIPPTPSVIVDIGCGTGSLLVELAQFSTAQLIGIDGDPAILARASDKAIAAGATVDLRDGRAEALPCPDASADVAIAALLLHHLTPDLKHRALSELHRVLRPGGRLLIADWGRPHAPLMRVSSLLLQLIDGFQTTRDHVAGRIPGVIQAAGFQNVRCAERWRTVWGTLELLRAERPQAP